MIPVAVASTGAWDLTVEPDRPDAEAEAKAAYRRERVAWRRTFPASPSSWHFATAPTPTRDLAVVAGRVFDWCRQFPARPDGSRPAIVVGDDSASSIKPACGRTAMFLPVSQASRPVVLHEWAHWLARSGHTTPWWNAYADLTASAGFGRVARELRP